MAYQTGNDYVMEVAPKRSSVIAAAPAHDEPWRVAGAALAVGALVGFLLARR